MEKVKKLLLPVIIIIILPINTAFIWIVCSPNNIYPSKNPAYIPSPPSLGIGLVCTFLALGISIAPIKQAILPTIGINNTVNKNVTPTIKNIFSIVIFTPRNYII